MNGSGAPNVYNNDDSDWTNGPIGNSRTYHTDGIITYGDLLPPSTTISFMLTWVPAAPPVLFFVRMAFRGTAAAPLDNGTNPLGPYFVYNSRIVGFLYQICAEPDSSINYTIEKNILLGNGSQWFLQGNNTSLTNLTSDHNIRWPPLRPVLLGSVSNGQFAQWQSAGEDPYGSNAHPNKTTRVGLFVKMP